MEDESSSVILAPAELPAPRYAIRASASSDVGLRHELNEDRFAVADTPGGALLVVCDGMGGMGRGDQASQLALSRLLEALSLRHAHPLDAVTEAIHAVDRELVSSFTEDGSGKQPGTTCAVVQVECGVAYVSWVGDSSVLLIRDGAVAERTRPHRVVQDLIDAGAMTAEEARTSPMARFLARSLGGRSPQEPVVEPSMLRPWRLVAGDAIVVCSDGLTDFVAPEEIASIVSGAATEDEAVQALIAEALARGVDDNVTAIVARCVHASGTGEADFLGPAWEHRADEPEEEEPDFHSDIRVADLPPEPAAPKGMLLLHPLVIAAVVFGGGVVLLALLAGLALFL